MAFAVIAVSSSVFSTPGRGEIRTTQLRWKLLLETVVILLQIVVILPSFLVRRTPHHLVSLLSLLPLVALHHHADPDKRHRIVELASWPNEGQLRWPPTWCNARTRLAALDLKETSCCPTPFSFVLFSAATVDFERAGKGHQTAGELTFVGSPRICHSVQGQAAWVS